jgi:hypothetical protein
MPAVWCERKPSIVKPPNIKEDWRRLERLPFDKLAAEDFAEFKAFIDGLFDPVFKVLLIPDHFVALCIIPRICNITDSNYAALTNCPTPCTLQTTMKREFEIIKWLHAKCDFTRLHDPSNRQSCVLEQIANRLLYTLVLCAISDSPEGFSLDYLKATLTYTPSLYPTTAHYIMEWVKEQHHRLSVDGLAASANGDSRLSYFQHRDYYGFAESRPARPDRRRDFKSLLIHCLCSTSTPDWKLVRCILRHAIPYSELADLFATLDSRIRVSEDKCKLLAAWMPLSLMREVLFKRAAKIAHSTFTPFSLVLLYSPKVGDMEKAKEIAWMTLRGERVHDPNLLQAITAILEQEGNMRVVRAVLGIPFATPALVLSVLHQWNPEEDVWRHELQGIFDS